MGQKMSESMLKCSPFSKLSSECKVMGSGSISDMLHIYKPYMAADWQLYDIVDIRSNKSIDITEINCIGSWIDIPWAILNQCPGQHTYKLCFVSSMNENIDKQYLYFGYIFQTDSFDKSYLYMNR